MGTIFSTPGNTAVTVTLLVINGVSLLIMFLFIFEFRHLHEKRMNILRALNGGMVFKEISNRRLLITLYIISTLCVTGLTFFLYIARPHLL